MKCPACASDSAIIDSRPTHKGSAIRRRYCCVECAQRWTTKETIANIDDATGVPWFEIVAGINGQARHLPSGVRAKLKRRKLQARLAENSTQDDLPREPPKNT